MCGEETKDEVVVSLTCGKWVNPTASTAASKCSLAASGLI